MLPEGDAGEHTAGVRTADALFAVLLVVAWLALVTLTAGGARRRGQGRSLALVTGLLFPLTWVAWYLIDQRSAGRARGRSAGAPAARGR
jgi:hypothetical protein